MANVRDLRRKVQVTMAVLVGLNVLAAGALLYMMVRGTNLLPAEFQSLHQQVQNKKSVIVPPKVVDERLNEAREQIAHFYENRFPNSSAAIFENLGKVAVDNHVRLSQASYNQVATKANEVPIPGVRQVEINANLTGNYVDAMKFINALEREKTFFIVDSVSLADQKAGNVRLVIRIETYLRGEA
jgi:Tfp pilus assembly protein PilO